MSGGAAPALPKLAATRPRVAHERPGAARRGHLAPTDQPQPHARFRDAPIMHTYSSAHAQPGRTHMHNTLHTTFPHASTHDQQQHLGSSSSSSSSDGGDDSDSDSNSYRQFATSFSGSIQQLHSSSTCRSVEFDSSACRQHSKQIRQLCIGFSRQFGQTVASDKTVVASSNSQCMRHVCHAVCCVGVTHFGFAVAVGQARQPRANPLRSVFAAVMSDFRGTGTSSIHLPHAWCVLCVVRPDPGGGIQISRYIEYRPSWPSTHRTRP